MVRAPMKKRVPVGVRVGNFPDGYRKGTVSVEETENDVQARLLWLENHGRLEVAAKLLEDYCSR